MSKSARDQRVARRDALGVSPHLSTGTAAAVGHAEAVDAVHSQLGNRWLGAALAGGGGAFGEAMLAPLAGAAAGLEVQAPPPSVLRRVLRQRSAGRGGGVSVEDLIARSAGEPLSEAVAERVGQAIGHDVRHVRVHRDGAAARASSELRAHAFALGADVFFGGGEYAPGTPRGDELLVHELTHVKQHDEGRIPVSTGGLEVSSPSDPLEQEAYAAEGRVGSLGLGGLSPFVGSSGAGSPGVGGRASVHRDAKAGSKSAPQGEKKEASRAEVLTYFKAIVAAILEQKSNNDADCDWVSDMWKRAADLDSTTVGRIVTFFGGHKTADEIFSDASLAIRKAGKSLDFAITAWKEVASLVGLNHKLGNRLSILDVIKLGHSIEAFKYTGDAYREAMLARRDAFDAWNAHAKVSEAKRKNAQSWVTGLKVVSEIGNVAATIAMGPVGGGLRQFAWYTVKNIGYRVGKQMLVETSKAFNGVGSFKPSDWAKVLGKEALKGTVDALIGKFSPGAVEFIKSHLKVLRPLGDLVATEVAEIGLGTTVDTLKDIGFEMALGEQEFSWENVKKSAKKNLSMALVQRVLVRGGEVGGKAIQRRRATKSIRASIGDREQLAKVASSKVQRMVDAYAGGTMDYGTAKRQLDLLYDQQQVNALVLADLRMKYADEIKRRPLLRNIPHMEVVNEDAIKDVDIKAKSNDSRSNGALADYESGGKTYAQSASVLKETEAKALELQQLRDRLTMGGDDAKAEIHNVIEAYRSGELTYGEAEQSIKDLSGHQRGVWKSEQAELAKRKDADADGWVSSTLGGEGVSTRHTDGKLTASGSVGNPLVPGAVKEWIGAWGSGQEAEKKTE